jgi:hypothetical protein
MITACWGVLLEISFQNRLRQLNKFGLYTYFQWIIGRAMNTKVLENFITFLTRDRTQGFDSEQRSSNQLKLIELKRYDF